MNKKPLSPTSVVSKFAIWNFNETSGSTISAESNLTIPALTISGTGDVWQADGSMSCEPLAANADNIISETTPDAELGSLFRMDDIPDGVMVIALELAFTAFSASNEYIVTYGRDQVASNSQGAPTPGSWGIFLGATLLGIQIRENATEKATTSTMTSTAAGATVDMDDGNPHTHVFTYDFANDAFSWYYDGGYYPIASTQISSIHDVDSMPTLSTNTNHGVKFFHRRVNNPASGILGTSANHQVKLHRLMVLKNSGDISNNMVSLARDFYQNREGLPETLREL